MLLHIARELAPLRSAAPVAGHLDRILAFAGESGLVVILHNDIDMPYGKVDT